MSGTAGPSPSGRKADESGGRATDLTYAARDLIKVVRETGTGIVVILPDGLSKAARAEIEKACSDLARTTDRYTKDVQALATAAWDKISDKTKQEMAELARDVAKKYGPPAEPSVGGAPQRGPSVESLTRGEGKRLRIKLPVKLSSHTDIHFLLNYDSERLLNGHLDSKLFKGAGVGATKSLDLGPNFKDARLRGEVFYDPSPNKSGVAAFILFEVKFDW